MGLLKAKFDLFVDGDLDLFNELLSDPGVIIERRHLIYRTKLIPGFDGEEDEFEEFLELTVAYTVNEFRDTSNLFRKAKVIRTGGFASASHRYYTEFMESPEREIISSKETYRDQQMFAVIEYIDLTDKINHGAGEDINRLFEGDDVVFDPESGSYIMI